jgi:hypothetical protein
LDRRLYQWNNENRRTSKSGRRWRWKQERIKRGNKRVSDVHGIWNNACKAWDGQERTKVHRNWRRKLENAEDSTKENQCYEEETIRKEYFRDRVASTNTYGLKVRTLGAVAWVLRRFCLLRSKIIFPHQIITCILLHKNFSTTFSTFTRLLIKKNSWHRTRQQVTNRSEVYSTWCNQL